MSSRQSMAGAVGLDSTGGWWLRLDGDRAMGLGSFGEPLSNDEWLERPEAAPIAARIEDIGSWSPESMRVFGRLNRDAMLRLQRLRVQREVAAYGELYEQERTFQPGIDPVPPSGRLVGAAEIHALVDASLDTWLTAGRFNEAFEKGLREYLGVPYVSTVNSGSSANLLAFAALNSPLLKDRAIKPGDEAITVAAGFPTTVNPILLYGMIPVFVDIDIPTYNVAADRLEAAVSPKTRAIVLAHTLGNPFDLDAVMRVARKHDLWVIEDCCDALGSTFKGRQVGTFGHIATLSFYPAHHITTGEGGAVFTSDATLARAIESIRDWGRDCWCPPGCDNSCGRRFSRKIGDLPHGYDHKYVYSDLGYNLKMTDMQAACGLAQLERLTGFAEARRRNFNYLGQKLAGLEQFLILPKATGGSDPSWFGFPITLREESRTSRVGLLRYLDRFKIGSRLLFGGNLTRQPYFKGKKYRVSGDLSNTDRATEQTFWVGVYPGLRQEMLDFTAEKLESFLAGNENYSQSFIRSES